MSLTRHPQKKAGQGLTMVVIQRIIRSKGSKVAELTGKTGMVSSLETLREKAKRNRWVFAYLTETGEEGIMRSGRVMRFCDQNVRNVVSSNITAW